jgi:glyoxylase-like metal-dependent hydrolase (beta-lactamase superfamily II)
MILKDMGKAGLAIMVIGSAACASASEEPEGSTTSEGVAEPPATPAVQSTTASTEPSAKASWHRANLGFVSAYIIYRDGEAALIDTGVPSSEGLIGKALEEVGLGWDAVGHVILTHRHDDHQGSLDAVLASAPEAAWYAGAEDMGAIAAPTAGVAVGDDDNVFGLDIIDSPGHTIGHISVLDSTAGVLVAGDALFGEDGGVIGSLPQFTTDMDLANASVSKLAGFDYDVLLFGHGDPILNEASRAVGALAASLG